jgi:catechol 2,3-dioxygenase-like lactoylglutathione lyase family enzyme
MFSLPSTTWSVRESSTRTSWKCRKSTVPASIIPESGKIGDGQQELHILVRADATFRRDKWIDFDDIHFALRVESYRDTLTWLREKGFREDLPDDDFRKIKLRAKSIAGYAQIYIIDPDRNIIEFNCETTD